jgi:hypothetical protein
MRAQKVSEPIELRYRAHDAALDDECCYVTVQQFQQMAVSIRTATNIRRVFTYNSPRPPRAARNTHSARARRTTDCGKLSLLPLDGAFLAEPKVEDSHHSIHHLVEHLLAAVIG